MKSFDYLLLLAAIFLGLALSDLAISTQRLLNVASRVKWGWLSPLAAILAFLKILTQWWSWFGGESIANDITFVMFAAFLVTAGLLFLLAATALPDHVAATGIDLQRFYWSVQRRFWFIFALHFVLTNAVTIWARLQFSSATYVASPALLIVPIAIALPFVRSRLVHATALIGFILLYTGQQLGHSLGA